MDRASAIATLRRMLPYAGVWLCLIAIVALTPLNALWHAADSWVLEVPLHLGEGIGLDRNLSIVDLNVDSEAGMADIRGHEVALLDGINAAAGVAAVKPSKGSAAACAAAAVHVGAAPGRDLTGAHTKPEAIVFDLAFLKANSDLVPQCEAPLIAELSAAQNAGIKIYGALDLEDPNAGGSITGSLALDPNYEANHDQQIYAQFTGKGHTEFSADPIRPSTPLIYYPKVVIMPTTGGGKAGDVAPCALPIVAAGQADDQCLPLIGLGQQDEIVNTIVPLGAVGLFDKARVTYDVAVRQAKSLDDQVVLIGDETIDHAAGDQRSKFEMLAWATSQNLAMVHGRPYPRVLVDFTIMLALAIGGALLALAGFAFGFISRKGKPFRLALATILAVLAPAVVFAAVEAALISHDELFSQLTFPALTVLVTIGVSLWAGIASIRNDLFVLSLQEHTTAVAEKYDVFISYARPPENAAWVEEHVLGPLSRARMPDGKPLRIFFDRQSIKVGFGWYTTIVEAIYGSRFFLPVYSEGYFDRPFCREEMDIAFLRQVGMETFVLPVARVVTGIPDRYARTQFIDVNREPQFMDDIIRIITGAAPPEAPVEKVIHDVSDRELPRDADGTDRGTAIGKAG